MTKIVGILNFTPDSFSDGGRYNEKNKALDHISELISDGASIIDIGSESTRPGAKALNQEEEWQRLEEILPEAINLIHESGAKVSIDTRNSLTAQKAIELGVDMINDPSALSDPKMIDILKNSALPFVLNHNLGIPANPQIHISEKLDVINELKNWAIEKTEKLIEYGIKRNQIIFDLGIGFGKTPKQSILLLSHLEEFQDLNLPIYIGHSRKSFLNQFEPKTNIDKDSLTAVFSAKIANYCDYIRVHNVKLNNFMIKNFSS